MRPAVMILAVLSSWVVALASGAEDSSHLYVLWTRAHTAVGEESSLEVLAELGAACDRERRRDRTETLYAAECQRWIGEQQLALGQYDAAAQALEAAHALYTESLGALNPLSGEVLHLMAEIYLERGDSFRAGLAMDRALAICPVVDRGGVERCQAVYAEMGREKASASCTGPLSSLSSASAASASPDQRVVSEPSRFDAISLQGERRHRGFFVGGHRSGYGLEIGAEAKEIWRGDYRDGALNGHAVFMGVRGESVAEYYSGGWEGGRRHGYGSYRHATGSRYTGEFRDGVQHGFGEVVFASGVRYSGGIVGSEFEGEGTLTVPGFLRYEGTWKKGQRQGQGVEIYVDGLMEYRGEYAEDQPQGYGRVLVRGQVVFAGELDPEVGVGFGFVESPKGETYIGQLLDGNPHGLGAQSARDGSIVTGVWAHSQHLREWAGEDFTAAAESDDP